MTILILANSKYKGGTSGSDEIYANFKKYWPCNFSESNCDIEYSPFFLCYLQRIIMSILRALVDNRKFDIVYSSTDFLPDSIPGFIYKLKGKKWVAGFFLKAFKSNPIHYYTQKMVRRIINRFADFVIVTNPTMYDIFHGKKKTWINGGIDLSLAGLSDRPRIYDAVFCGRIHPSKGIDELLEIWDLVRKKKPNARLAIIGDGDLGVGYIKHKLFANHGLHQYNGIDLLGYMGDERFEIYKRSITVLYPTPLKYDHFSMAPVEAMSCGCVMFSWDLPSMEYLKDMDFKSFRINAMDDTRCFAYCLTEWITDNPNTEHFFNLGIARDNSIKSAQQFDYQNQAMRVWKELNICMMN